MSNNYISYRAYQETQYQIKNEKLQKVAALLSLAENPEDPMVQAAIFEEVDLDPTTLTLEDFLLLEEIVNE